MLHQILEKPEHKWLFVFTGIIHLITGVFSVFFSNLYHFETVNKNRQVLFLGKPSDPISEENPGYDQEHKKVSNYIPSQNQVDLLANVVSMFSFFSPSYIPLLLWGQIHIATPKMIPKMCNFWFQVNCLSECATPDLD